MGIYNFIIIVLGKVPSAFLPYCCQGSFSKFLWHDILQLCVKNFNGFFVLRVRPRILNRTYEVKEKVWSLITLSSPLHFFTSPSSHSPVIIVFFQSCKHSKFPQESLCKCYAQGLTASPHFCCFFASLTMSTHQLCIRSGTIYRKIFHNSPE